MTALLCWPTAFVLAVAVAAGALVLVAALGASVVLVLTLVDRVLCFAESILTDDYNCQIQEDDDEDDEEDEDKPAFPTQPPDRNGEAKGTPPPDPEVDALEL